MIRADYVPVKKIEFKKKYVYITLNTGQIIRHPKRDIRMRLELFVRHFNCPSVFPEGKILGDKYYD